MRLFKPFMGRRKGLSGGIFSAFVAAVLLTAAPAEAKDLTGRLGIGFTNDFSNSTSNRLVPAISTKYGLSKDLHLLGAVGFNTQSPAAYTLGGKVFKNIFYETNLNFFMMAGLAYLKDVKSGVEILGALGAEFFIPGVDSLGLIFEAGASASNVTGSFVLKTIGYTFLHAGMHFYF